MENSWGYQKLAEAIKKDCSKENKDCFNPDGCNQEHAGCSRYCNKFKWTIDRAKHYSEKLRIPASDILDSWEKGRDYWYMNYYQDCNQPLIGEGKVRVFDTIEQLRDSIKDFGFRCPLCSGISKDPSECDSGVIVKGINGGKDGPCNWKVYGLLKDMGKGIFVYVKSELTGHRIFMPIAWESEFQNVG